MFWIFTVVFVGGLYTWLGSLGFGVVCVFVVSYLLLICLKIWI